MSLQSNYHIDTILSNSLEQKTLTHTHVLTNTQTIATLTAPTVDNGSKQHFFRYKSYRAEGVLKTEPALEQK